MKDTGKCPTFMTAKNSVLALGTILIGTYNGLFNIDM
jgi:hypothetical protein